MSTTKIVFRKESHVWTFMKIRQASSLQKVDLRKRKGEMYVLWSFESAQ